MIPKKRGADKGQALVEFALILIVILLFIFVIIEAGRLFQGWLTLQNAARSAGRYAMTGQFETDCLFTFPACLDPRVHSIKDQGRRAASGLNIDDAAVVGEPLSFVTELWSVDESGAWIPDFAGGSADPIRVRVTYYMPVITPLLRPIAETVRLRGQVVVVAEDFDQLGTSQAQSSAPPIGDAGDPGDTGGLPELDLEIVKTASSANVLANTPLDYTLDVVNYGPFVAEDVTVVDTLPPGTTFITGTVTGGGFCDPPDPSLVVTCFLPDLAGDGSVLSAASVIIETNSPDLPGEIITNTATVFNGTTALDKDLSNNTDSATVTLRPPLADLAVAIADSPPVLVNTPLTYTLNVDNLGPDVATGVAVTVTLSSDLGTPTVPNGPCSFTPPVTVRCDVPSSLSSGSSQEFKFVFTPSLTGTVTATAQVAGNEDDPEPLNDSATISTIIADILADAYVQKSGPSGSVSIGTAFTYTILAGNNGPDFPVGSLEVTDTLPPNVIVEGYSSGCNDVSGGEIVCTTGSLNPGEWTTFTITVTADTAEVLTNKAVVTGDVPDPVPFNNTSLVNTTIAGPDLELSKSGAEFVLAGNLITYTLIVTNIGPGVATDVMVVDTLPPNLSGITASPSPYCLPSGLSVICGPGPGADAGPFATMNPGDVITAIITGTAPAADIFVNSATVSNPQPDPDESNNTDVVTSTTVLASDLEVSKFAIPDLTATEGGVNAPLIYFLQVVNKGPSVATGVVVTDTLPAGVTFGSASPGCTPAGNWVTCTISEVIVGPTINYTINVTPTVPGVITNTVDVSGIEVDLVGLNNTASITTTILPADLVIKKFAPATSLVTETFTYTIVLTNTGPASAIDVVVTDTLPVSVTNTIPPSASKGMCSSNSGLVICDVGKMVVGEIVTVTISVTPIDIGLAENKVEVTGGGTDPSQTSDDVDTAVTNIVPVADLAIDKKAEGPFYAGEPLTYTLVVSNYGPSVATGVSITDTLPPGVSNVSASTSDGTCPTLGATVICNLNAIPVSGTVAITIVVTAGLEGDYVNDAEVGGIPFDPDLSNNTASVTTTVLPAADLAISKSASGSLLLEQPLTYTVRVDNLGPSEALAVTVEDVLPAELTNVTVPAGDFTCGGSGTLTCSLASLPSGNSATITIVGIPVITGTITNTAQVSSTITDLYGSNDIAEIAVVIDPAADLTISKSAAGSFLAGDPLTYTLDVSNAGPSPATNMTVVDNLPAGVTFDDVNSSTDCTEGGGVVTCTVANLAIGATQQFVIVVDVPSSVAHGTVLQNDASASATEADPVPGDNSDSVQTTINREVDLRLEKIASHDPVAAGTNLTYTLIITNDGPSDASSVVISDTMISELNFVGSVPGGSCGEAGGIVTCNISGGIASGASDSVQIIVQVDPSVSHGSRFINVASVSAAENDSDPLSNRDTEESEAIRSSDLRVIKNDENDPIAASETQTYTIQIWNDGPSDASNVTVTDILAGVLSYDDLASSTECSAAGQTVTCDNFDVAAGGSKLLTIVAELDSAAPEGILNNTATVSHPRDPDSSNDSGSESSTIILKTDMTIEKSGWPDPVVAGTTLTYTLVVTNNGPSDSTGSSIGDSLPPALHNAVYCEATSGASCTPSTTYTGTIALGPLAKGEATTFLIRADVSSSQRNDLINTAKVSTNEKDPIPSSNSDTDTTVVAVETDLGIAKSGTPDPVLAGETLTYTIVVSNSGPSDASTITVTDVLTDVLTFSAADSSTECDVSVLDTQAINCLAANMDAGDTITFTVVATVSSSVISGTSLANTASVSATEFDPISGNDSSPITYVMVVDLPT